MVARMLAARTCPEFCRKREDEIREKCRKIKKNEEKKKIIDLCYKVLGDKLMKSENFEMAISEIIWLLTLLANQSILIHNLKNPKDKKDLLAEEELELLTTPLQLTNYKEAIIEAMNKGTNRNIESENTYSKNKSAE